MNLLDSLPAVPVNAIAPHIGTGAPRRQRPPFIRPVRIGRDAGALAGMVAGAVTVVLWAEFVKKPALAAGQNGWSTVYEIVPGFIACALVAVLVSLADKVPSKEVQERFAKADADYRAAK